MCVCNRFTAFAKQDLCICGKFWIILQACGDDSSLEYITNHTGIEIL